MFFSGWATPSRGWGEKLVGFESIPNSHKADTMLAKLWDGPLAVFSKLVWDCIHGLTSGSHLNSVDSVTDRDLKLEFGFDGVG